jgi:hypothetical protein
MNHLPPALPARASDDQRSSRSARWTAGFVIAVGFGFMGSALIGASEPSDRVAVFRPASSAPAAMDISGPTSGHAESYEVDSAVRNWVWEAKSPEQKPSRSYDFAELWLAR